MDKLLQAVGPLAEHPVLRTLSFLQLVDFLTTISLLKRSISLVQRAGKPTDKPPDVLPRLIQRFLAESLRMDMGVMPDAWSILKDYAWDMLPLASHVKQEKDAFSAHGWSKGLSE
jgi:hypothetical protein